MSTNNYTITLKVIDEYYKSIDWGNIRKVESLEKWCRKISEELNKEKDI